MNSRRKLRRKLRAAMTRANLSKLADDQCEKLLVIFAAIAKPRVNSRAKGARGEREAATEYLCGVLGFTAKRGVQHAGGVDSPDLIVEELPNVNIEVKYGVKGLDLGTKLLDEAREQSSRDAGLRKNPCVLWKPRGAHQWRLTVPYIAGCYTVADDETIRRELVAINQTATPRGDG